MKYFMRYETSPQSLAKAPANVAAHRQRLKEFHARGVLLMAGPLGNPPEAALGVFTTREAAEEFVQGDPFVQNGVATSWSIKEWNEVLA